MNEAGGAAQSELVVSSGLPMLRRCTCSSSSATRDVWPASDVTRLYTSTRSPTPLPAAPAHVLADTLCSCDLWFWQLLHMTRAPLLVTADPNTTASMRQSGTRERGRIWAADSASATLTGAGVAFAPVRAGGARLDVFCRSRIDRM